MTAASTASGASASAAPGIFILLPSRSPRPASARHKYISYRELQRMPIEGFAGPLAHELAVPNVRANLAEPAYSPTTRLTSNGRSRMERSSFPLVPRLRIPWTARPLDLLVARNALFRCLALCDLFPGSLLGHGFPLSSASTISRRRSVAIAHHISSELIASTRGSAGHDPFPRAISRPNERLARPPGLTHESADEHPSAADTGAHRQGGAA